MGKVKRALVSVSDKEGLVEFVKGLQELEVEVISTGGTARTLSEAGLTVVEVSSVTRFPEMLNGRVKTLHPIIAAGILADRSKEEHMWQLKEYGIEPIDMVVVNLYPFAQTVAKPDVTLEEAIENIDIGGPTLIRAAAKNFTSVAVVVDPESYSDILNEMREKGGGLGEDTRVELAKRAFKHTADYDATIFEYLRKGEKFSELLQLDFTRIMKLRYGENPHQEAAFYQQQGAPKQALVNANQRHGKELSYNNILDLDSAWALVCEFDEPTVVVVKHNNPCGVASAEDIVIAYERAYKADSLSAFGGVVALNRELNEDVARQIGATFIEAVIAPGFTDDALSILTRKPGIRLLDTGGVKKRSLFDKDLRRVDGGLLVQDFDAVPESRDTMEVATPKEPTAAQWEDLLFAWKVVKHVKSNAIVLVKNKVTVGIGAGQMSRVDSTFMAAKKAGELAPGTVLASDAFFPFRDALDVAVEAGAVALIQPGGSVRDNEVIDAANEHDVPMVFTGKRHFKH